MNIVTRLKRGMNRALSRRAPRIPALGVERRLQDLESRLDQTSREVAATRVELNAQTRRLTAVVDFYETRIDRIYARLSSSLAERAHGAVIVETDTSADDRIMSAFREGLGLETPPEAPTLALILTHRLTEGDIPSPLTLQGFRINRERARELGDRVQVFAATGDVSPGVALYGPYKDLAPGAWRLIVSIAPVIGRTKPRPKGRAAFDVFSATTGDVLAQARIEAKDLVEPQRLSLPFVWSADHAMKGVEFRVHQRSTLPFDLLSFRLEHDDAQDRAD